MAVRISPPQNKTYYINPAYLTFVENSGYGANLIQVSASSSCYISVYDPANGIGYSDADRNYQRWKVTAYNNKFPDNGAWYIYVRLEKNNTVGMIVYSKTLYQSSDDTYYYIKIGDVSATDGTSIREITYDTGYLESDQGKNEGTELNEMWELDKHSTPWLIKAKQWLDSFTVKGFITLVGGLIFKRGNIEKPVTDLRRSIDNEPEFIVDENGVIIKDENGAPIPNPEFVPISDETIPTTKWVTQLSDDRYIRKDQPDETEYRVKFFDGIEAGHFVQGALTAFGGSGTRFDGDGYGEMNGLTLREFLEVPELRFNRIDVVSGILWNSIAFGLIESVDTTHRICRLKLEDGERSGLHELDICMGIFSDFGEGTVKEEYDESGELKDPGHDENGLPRMYGFSTSYFTPIKILVNEPGAFEFQYRLQEGTTRHPCESMKFAVYGNFRETSRQASAYSTRTYKRYLNNVNTWKLDPNKNIYAQYGDIDGLTIGGYTMKGYGSFQNNVYLTGATFQFTPQQKEELKGKDAYAVTLSDYEGIVVIDDEGNIVGGEQTLVNVVSGTENVKTTQKEDYATEDGRIIKAGEYNVTTVAYKLSTRVYASRGDTMLHHSLIPEEGGYIISLDTVGCTAAVLNGVVVVTSVSNPKNCKVNISVNCEGKAAFTLSYHITAVTDGKNPVIADLDNEMDSVACGPEGNVIFGLPVSTTVSMWAGTKQLNINRVEISAPSGITVNQVLVNQNGTPLDKLTSDEAASIEFTECVVSVPEGGIAADSDRTLPIFMTVYAMYGGALYHRDLTFTVNKVVAGDNAVIYKLSPSVPSIVKDKYDTLSVQGLSCSVVGFDGKKSAEVSELPSNLRMEYSVDKGEAKPYTIGDRIAVTAENREFAFLLFQETDEEETKIDSETVFVIRDGVENKSVIAYIRSNTEPGTPTGGTYDSPKPTSSPEWFLSAPQGEEILWCSFRTFLSSQPTSGAWSKPAQMTDTASLKMIWSSVEDPEALPKAPEFNPDWTDDPDENAIWMAASTMSNGIWSDWKVSKVRGADALQLVASTSTVARNSFGSYVPQSLRVRALRGGVEEEANITVYGVTKDNEAVVVSGSTKCSVVDLDLSSLYAADYSRLVFRAYQGAINDYYDKSSLSETSVTFIGDGSSGPMPRNCGKHDVGQIYYYNNEYRDFVWATDSGGVKVFMRDGFGYNTDAYPDQDKLGGVSGTVPLQAPYWIEVPKTVMTAIDTALIDNANIAGFMYQGGRMVSQDMDVNTNPLPDAKLILDGTTGYLKCVDADVDGNLNVRNLSHKILFGWNEEHDLTGYSMGVGPGVFLLPSLSPGENKTIQAFLPSNLEGVAKSMTIQVSNAEQPMWIYDPELEANTLEYAMNLAYDTVYTLIGVGGTTKLGPTFVSGYWLVASSTGGSSGATSRTLVDMALSEDSKNPIANSVITKALNNKIQKVDKEPENPDPSVLYVITG